MGLRVICGILGAALLAGCAGLQGIFKDPEVNLQRAVLRGVGPTGGAMDLIVGVHNPNNFDLHGTKLRVGFVVEDSHVGDLEYDNDFQVQKGDTAVLTLPVRFNWSGLASAARAALGYGEIPYSLKGLLTVETPFGDRQVSFTHQGRAPLNRIGGLMAIPTGQ